MTKKLEHIPGGWSPWQLADPTAQRIAEKV